MAAFQQEQKKVAELQGALSSQMKTMEIEYSKLRNANKVSLNLLLITHVYLPIPQSRRDSHKIVVRMYSYCIALFYCM